jgi:CDP-diacylglycerol---serine O-phosphatidyltransferase
MSTVKSSIPNLITTANLVCGVLSVYFASFDETREMAAYLILMAMVFDFLDGMAARLLQASSPVGKELDSLSDLVSFGVAPAVLLMHHFNDLSYASVDVVKPFYFILLLLLVPALSALRLARFNLDTRQTIHFIGLPTPANALLLTSLFLMQLQPDLPPVLLFLQGNPYTITLVALFAALLLNSQLHLFSLKIHFAAKTITRVQICLLTGGLALFVLFQFAAIPLITLAYIFLSIVFKASFSNMHKC